MKKIIKLTESDLRQIVENVLLETQSSQLSEATYTDKVIAIQKALIKAGYSVGATGADGLYGENTKSAVMKYQKDNGIKQTGFVGPVTAAKLGVESLTGTSSQTPATTSSATSSAASSSVSVRQKNINNAYCSSDGGIILAKNSKINGWKWSYYVSKFEVTNAEIETAKKSCKKSTNYSLTPRIDRELEFIKLRNLDNRPFFIYDPVDNLLYLFDQKAVLVDYTQVVDGADRQKENTQSFSITDWCKASGHDASPHLCTDKKTKKPTDPFYSVLANKEERFIAKGIYDISFIYRKEEYSGAGNNTFYLKDNTGRHLSAAIHGIPKDEGRLKASKDLEVLLKKNIQSGKVPQEYLGAIKKIANANQSYGCVGVPAKFIENPKVQKIVTNARVFVMGEDKSYLVQRPDLYFEKLSGSGESCVDPTSLAKSFENMA